MDFESQIRALFDQMILAKNLANHDPPTEKKNSITELTIF